MNYKDKYLKTKHKYITLKKELNEGQTGGKKYSILKDYKKIVDNDKRCSDYPLKTVRNASRGMYVHPENILKQKSKKELCHTINKSYKNNHEPFVHDDSLTAWGNQAAELYGLEIRDILSMNPGDEIKVILLDRNVGDYMDGTKEGTKYDPKKHGLSYGRYIHGKNLTGIMISDAWVNECFEWEINKEQLGGPFWGPIKPQPRGCDIKPGESSCKIKHNYADFNDIKKLNPKTKVGWRGPAISLKDAKKFMPSKVTHYGNWWNDYLSFKTHNFLKVNRSSKKLG